MRLPWVFDGYKQKVIVWVNDLCPLVIYSSPVLKLTENLNSILDLKVNYELICLKFIQHFLRQVNCLFCCQLRSCLPGKMEFFLAEFHARLTEEAIIVRLIKNGISLIAAQGLRKADQAQGRLRVALNERSADLDKKVRDVPPILPTSS